MLVQRVSLLLAMVIGVNRSIPLLPTRRMTERLTVAGYQTTYFPEVPETSMRFTIFRRQRNGVVLSFFLLTRKASAGTSRVLIRCRRRSGASQTLECRGGQLRLRAILT